MNFIEITLLTFFLLSYIVCIVFGTRHYLHMFQLNSYKVNVQLEWLNKKRKLYLSKSLPSLILIVLVLLFPEIGFAISGAFLLLIAYTNKPGKAKKPLVYTKRVLRLLATIAIISVIILVPVSVATFRLYAHSEFIQTILICVTVAYFIALPFTVLLADFINKPMEKKINEGFIKEAEDIIKSMPDLKVIGITGSYGKTSVKYFLTKLLSAKYEVLMTPESYNTTMGVVRTIREQMRGTHQIFVCEMGARNVGDIKEICDIVHPDCGIITSIGPQHLESFHTLDNIKKTKFELADSLDDKDMLFINANDENIKSVGYSRKNTTYGIDAGDYSAFDIKLSSKGTDFKIKVPSGEIAEFSTKLIGEHNVQNIAGAIATANFMGVSLTSLQPYVRKLESVPHRLELINRGDMLIIDDAYNSNPNGARVALNTLSMFEGVKIAVTPGMVELGDKQDAFNYEFGVNMTKVCDYIILVGRGQTQSIAQGVLSTDFPDHKLITCDTIEQAFEKLYAIDSKGKQKVALLENDLPDNFL